MNRLFAELYFDENVPIQIAQILRTHGIAVTTARDAGMLGAADEDHMAYATDRGLAVVTLDRGDFETIAKEWFNVGKDHFGLFLMFRRTDIEFSLRLLDYLNQVADDEMTNRVVYL